MSDAFGDLESARATIEGQLERARERNAAMSVLADRVDSTSATVRSPRGEVAVTATAAITDVKLAESALTLHPQALGKLLTETIARAQHAAADLAITAAEETLGADSGLVAELRADVDSRFAPAPHDDYLR